MKAFLRVFFIVSAFLAWVMVPLNSYPQPSKPSEYQVKAAFLCNFAKFIEWPDESITDSNTTMNLFVLGEDPFGSDLDAIQGMAIRGRTLVIKRIKSLRDMHHCHMLFICDSEKDRLEQILKSLKGLSVLTISDQEGFGQRGVIINFYIRERKVRFEINMETAKRVGLKISSKLLQLGKIVYSAPSEKEK